MARKVILETAYTFSPGPTGVGYLLIPRPIKRENLILITNVTRNIVIYNFSDPNLKATNYTIVTSGGTASTTIVLEYDTSIMSSTDKIQVVIDEYDERFTPSETYLDPVNKLRVSEAQALIDTDFEYGTQTTKWENVSLTNNRPFAFPSSITLSNVAAISLPTSSRTVAVTLSSGTAPANGTFIGVQDTFLSIANGNFIIESGGGTGTFTYSAYSVNTTSITDIFDTNKTAIYQGTVYSSAQIGGTPTITISGTAVTIVTTIPHGLAIGNEIAIIGITGTNPPNGTFNVSRIISSTEFVIYAPLTPSGLTTTNAKIYVIPQSQFLHRPFDGGVIFSTNSMSNYDSAIRQTRRYFRYQSGKGIQISSGTILKPNLQVDSLTFSGATVTVTTKERHNILPGAVINISGASPSTYNGQYTITSITGNNTFEYNPSSAPSSTPASGLINVGVAEWYGAANRMGMFDSQNGIFYEYDGKTLYAVRRKSTFQISGKVSVTNGSSTVTQTNASFPTFFAKQLNPGDFIVIRGQSYRIVDIASDTSLTISPAYRAATASYCVVSLTEDVKTPQSEWNIDRCDGTGPSGFTIDLSKMQMFYIDFSWYGAGFIRWGFRGPNGDIIYCHKVANNNVNNEAYMRSGNLPARYESTTEPPRTTLAQTLTSGETTLYVRSTTGFPPTGTLLVRNANNYEYMNYSGAGTTTFTGLIRARSGGTPSLSLTQNSNVAAGTTTNLQIGQRVIATGVPDGSYITSIGSGTITLNRAATSTGSQSSTIVAIGTATPTTFTYSATDPIAVEMAYPIFSPTISHWGTSVIMDGRFDDDKSLIFTYGQLSAVNLTAGSTRALLSIRVAPSVDNSIGGIFGARELVNRMQLTLNTFDILSAGFTNSNLLVRAYLNSTPSSTVAWTNAVGNAANVINSSLAQIADYSASGTVTVSGGEVVAGFFVGTGSNSIELTSLRNLGNSVLGGGTLNSNEQIYPDGPDTLTLVVTNLTSQTVGVFGRISWTEAQA